MRRGAHFFSSFPPLILSHFNPLLSSTLGRRLPTHLARYLRGAGDGACDQFDLSHRYSTSDRLIGVSASIVPDADWVPRQLTKWGRG